MFGLWPWVLETVTYTSTNCHMSEINSSVATHDIFQHRDGADTNTCWCRSSLVMNKSKGGQCVTGNDGCILDLILAFPENFRLKHLRQNYSPVSLCPVLHKYIVFIIGEKWNI